MIAPKSLRWRLQIWHGTVLLLVLASFGLATYRYQLASELRKADGELRDRLGALMETLPRPPPGRPPPGESLSSFPADRAEAAIAEGGYYYVAWRRDGKEWSRSSHAPEMNPQPPRASSEDRRIAERTRGSLRESYTFTRPGECLLVGRSLEPEFASLREFAARLAAIGGAVLVLGLLGGGWMVGHAIRPVRAIADTARKIAAGKLGERIAVTDRQSELGTLSEVLNQTFASLEASFERQTRFAADAAHELRTPAAIILAQAQATLARDRQPEEYRQALEACVQAARRLQRLAESLLELANAESGANPLWRTPEDLASVARDGIDRVRPLAEVRGIVFVLDLQPSTALVDRDRIDQIVANLLTNALQFSPDGSVIEVSTGIDSADAWLRVRDQGEGIAPEHLPKLFDRFYRADPSRSRRTGGAGLGLAICRQIAEDHGGTIEVTSEPGRGSVFTLRLRHCEELSTVGCLEQAKG
jgi:two-component system, OmpR family, sensor kinase